MPIFPFLIFFMILPCCITAQAGQSTDSQIRDSFDANNMARDAAARLEAALSGGNKSNTSSTPASNTSSNTSSRNRKNTDTNTAPTEETRGGKQPAWVNDPYVVYKKDQFVAAVGSGANRSAAANKALAELVAIFGRSVNSTFTTVTNYTEAMDKGVVSVSESVNVRDQIATAASMNNLVGAEIGNVWDSGKGTFYVAAYLYIERTIAIYSDMIILNNQNIDMLTTMSNAERNTLDGYARFKLASQIAGINSNYAGIVNQLGGNTAILKIKTPESLNVEASNIIKNVTVTIRVRNDRVNRIQDAFAKVLGSEGIRTRGNNPLYSLEVDVNTSEVSFANNPNKFCRIEVSANLIENSTGASLLAFNFNDRIGHTSYANAEAQAFVSAEKIIAERYSERLSEFLDSLIPN